MHTSQPSTPRGQALVLIALAAVGLFAFAALAIDGGAVFADRRHSQNASDTAAYAAALARVRSNPNWQQAGQARAKDNGYDESDGVTEVYVHLCSTPLSTDDGIPLVCQGLPSGADPAEYVHVYIKSVVNLTFARVIGWQQMTNRTDAVVRAAPVEIDEWFNGKAIVSTKKDCPKPGDNYVPLVFGGNGTTIINNSGFFVNSSCEPAMKDAGNSNEIKTSEGVCVYGGVPSGVDGFKSLDGSPLPPDDHCGKQIEITDYWMPDSDPSLLASYCSQEGQITGSSGNYVAEPGWFNKTGNKTFPDASPAGTLKLKKGVYCLYNGISINSNWTITSDFDGDGQHDSATEGVFFYIVGGDVTFNGGANATLHAMDSTAGGFDSRLLHYLIFIPSSHEATVYISGNSASTFTGMIFAPASHVTLEGSGSGFSLGAQIIAYDTTITGDGSLNITYDPDNLPPAVIMPKLSPTE